VDRTPLHARGVDAMMARGRDGLLPGCTRASALQKAHDAPCFRLVGIEAVHAVARGHARLAAGARIEVDLERELLAGSWVGQRDEISVASLFSELALFVQAREPLDSGRTTLFQEVLIDEGESNDRR